MKILSILFVTVILLLYQDAQAQWIQTAGPVWGFVNTFTCRDGNLFAGTTGGGILFSTDKGNHWDSRNNGLGDLLVRSLAISDTNLVAGTNSMLFVSSNGGALWRVAAIDRSRLRVHCLGAVGGALFAGTGSGLYQSSDNGMTWSSASSTLADFTIHCLAIRGPDIFVGTDGAGVFCSTDGGSTWTDANAGLTSLYVRSLAATCSTLFAGTYDGVFRSTNGGDTWQSLAPFGANPVVWSFAVSGMSIFAGKDDGVFLSTNNGDQWIEVNAGLSNRYIVSLAIAQENLFAGAGDGHAWRRPLSQMVTSVEPFKNELPHGFSLSQNYPNPFNPSTTIRYELPRLLMVRLSVFDILGREVAVLVNEWKDAGVFEVTFSAGGGSSPDGPEDWSRQTRLGGNAAGLATGMYFYRIQAGEFMQSKKLILAK